MHLVDYHTHSVCSPDSRARLEDMVTAGRKAGLRELCTTDHCDLQQQDGSPLKSWDWAPILEQYERTVPLCGKRLRLLLGLELGGAHTDPDMARTILAGAPLDFVIGSVHNQSPASGGKDLFYMDFTREETCRGVVEDYMSSLLELSTLPLYDALGHIIYPLRYINGRGGHNITLEPWYDQLDKLLLQVIHCGHAIEVNTHGGREVEEWLPILRRYHALGGELVTLGSDAHRPYFVGRGLAKARDLLEETGFRYLTHYRRRVPEQIKL